MDGFIGEVIAFAGDFVPQGWLPCDGRTIPSDDPSALGFYIGTKYGNGSEVRVPALPPLTAKDGKTFNYIVCNSGRQLSAYLPYVLADIRHFAVDDDNLSQPYFDWFNTSGGAVDAINFQQLAFVLNNRFNPSGSFKPLILPSVPPLPSTTGSGTVATKICHNGAQPQYGPGSSPADRSFRRGADPFRMAPLRRKGACYRSAPRPLQYPRIRLCRANCCSPEPPGGFRLASTLFTAGHHPGECRKQYRPPSHNLRERSAPQGCFLRFRPVG